MSARRRQTTTETVGRRWSNVPTKEEISEGVAYHAHQADPENVALQMTHQQAFNALSRAQGRSFTCWRCQSCRVFATGRRRNQPCGHCGEILTGIEQRAAA